MPAASEHRLLTFNCVPCPQVKKVYLLVRGKRNLSAHERVQKLLCGPLFHKLHAEAAAGGRSPFSKVHGVEGDMELPGLGLSSVAKQLLLSEVDVVMHAAASLTLDAHIQDALRCAGSMDPLTNQAAGAACGGPAQKHASHGQCLRALPQSNTQQQQQQQLPVAVDAKVTACLMIDAPCSTSIGAIL
jgi:hypothetical protein